MLLLCLAVSGVGYAQEGEEVTWTREISAGYDKATGNTRDSQLSLDALLSRKRQSKDEITLKGSVYYSSADRKMDDQKWYGLGRYAFSFGSDKKWYNFYRFEADHDILADIDYRLVPAAGLGYWLYDLPELKLMVEAAIGLEYTEFRSAKEETKEMVLAPRAFFEKKIFDRLIFSEDFYAYPQVEDFSKYRLRSETSFTSPLTESLSLKFSLIDDYNSDPPEDIKKNDMQFISSLMYSF